MVKVEDVISKLKGHIELLSNLTGRELSGYALIVAPDGSHIDIIDLGSETEGKTFLEGVGKKVARAMLLAEQPRDPFGAIRTTR